MTGEITLLAYFAILAATLMISAHYIAPRITGRKLHRIEAYGTGCVIGIILPCGGWLFSLWTITDLTTAPLWLIFVGIVAIIAGAGAGTALSWAADNLFGTRAEMRVVRRGSRGGQS